MRGRPTKPTVVKELQGTARAHRTNKAEPQPTSGDPGCPKELTGEARKEWHRISAELASIDLLKITDRAAMAVYCQSWKQWLKLQRDMTKRGLGVPEQMKLGRMSNELAKLMHRYLTEFGLTPASRTRIKTPEKPAEDPLGDIIRGISMGN